MPAARRDVPLDLASLSDRLAGLVVAELEQPAEDTLALRFTNGDQLVIRPEGGLWTAVLHRPADGAVRSDAARGPTRRQREYLDFIRRYMHRFGVAPAETDVQEHFLVSAPSVNQMIRTLERKGYITRDRDWFGKTVPRSIRVLWDD